MDLAFFGFKCSADTRRIKIDGEGGQRSRKKDSQQKNANGLSHPSAFLDTHGEADSRQFGWRSRKSCKMYLQQYPQLQEDLKVHFEVHRAMRENLLLDPRRVQDGESLQESEPISFEVGPKLADYEIVGELGRGGMGWSTRPAIIG